MKLILVNRYFFPDESATSRMLTSLGRSLANHGWSVHVLASRSLHNDSSVRLAERETVEGVEVHRLRTTAFGRGWLPGRAIDYATFHLAIMWHLLRLARRGDLCIVCTDPPLISVTALLPMWLRGFVLVNWLHDLFPEVAVELGIGSRDGALARMALWLRDLSLRGAPVSVAPIQRMTKYLEHRGIPADALVTINYWSDGDAVLPVDPDRNALRKEWGLGDRFVVGYSGNFGRAHDFSTFLDAAARLRDHGDIVFTFVGGGHQKGAIEAAVAERELSNVLLKPLQPRERLAEALGVPDLHLISLVPTMEPFIVPSKLYGILAAGRQQRLGRDHPRTRARRRAAEAPGSQRACLLRSSLHGSQRHRCLATGPGRGRAARLGACPRSSRMIPCRDRATIIAEALELHPSRRCTIRENHSIAAAVGRSERPFERPCIDAPTERGQR